jgi:hypothetical protein
MRLDDAIKWIDVKITELEKELYVHDTVVMPRVDEDRKILRTMRDQRVKMAALRDKIEVLNKRRQKGESIPSEQEITSDELRETLPEAFR